MHVTQRSEGKAWPHTLSHTNVEFCDGEGKMPKSEAQKSELRVYF